MLSTLRPCANTQERRRLLRAGEDYRPTGVMRRCRTVRGARRTCVSSQSEKQSQVARFFSIKACLNRLNAENNFLVSVCVSCCQGDECFPLLDGLFMYRDATACFFIALEENNWKHCLDTGRMMGLVILHDWVGGWVGGLPHNHTTPQPKQNSPLGLIHSQSDSLSFSFLKRRENQRSSL